ncbi:MAG TPA: FMN-binding protein [Petrotogaceae bacterium]|nr:FMN-binding protein [Petrotogaceae bacterium]HPA92498.1 FMN-binding protein [Petrotogaceae bacterium]HQF33202.1 FMN-binding protein [Petrotogaceae bacterium]HQH32692.1 FMN-binding protein [Petrotogaceae bacterium]HQI78926.1 FMN-binding protein [Petrotogaceae bacterium]
MNRNSKIYTVLFTFIISFVFILILSFFNGMTIQRTEKNKTLSTMKAILNSMGIEYADDDQAYALFSKSIKHEKKDSLDIYTFSGLSDTAIAVIFNGSGLWGSITGSVAFDKDISMLLGVDFISQNETPGLGGRIEEKWFKDQFKNRVVSEKPLELSKNKTGKGIYDSLSNEIDAVTGASLTSTYLLNIINSYIYKAKKVLGVSRYEH